jgi:NAD(P)H-hydrate epimerase
MMARFVTAGGIEVPAVSAAQMREVDRVAVEETGPSLVQMMENAGRTLALDVLEGLGEAWRSAQVVVLAGTGGNGGGGICAARHLVNRGVDVRLCFSDARHLGEIPALQRRIFAHAGGQEVAPDGLFDLRPALIVDAVLGYSLQGAPRISASALIRWANASGIPIVALDVPSGVDATTGATPGDFVRATRTLALALPKAGLTTPAAGELALADLGIPAATFRRIGLSYHAPFGTRFRIPLIREA